MAFTLKVVPVFSGHTQTFPSNGIRMTKSSMSGVKCSSNTSTDVIGKIRERMRGKVDNSVPSSLCMIDALQMLGVDRYFQSEINNVLHNTYRLWKDKDMIIFKDVSCCAIAFRLLRVKGYQVSSDVFAEQEVDGVEIAIGTIVEVYRASQERLYEDEETLVKLHDWSINLLRLNHNTINPQVEYLLENYHGMLDRVAVRRSLDHYQIPQVADSFPNQEFLEFARQDFNISQAQHHKQLEQLHRWYAGCRLDTLNYGREAVSIGHFLASAIFGEPELSDARLAFAKHVLLITRIDDFFDHAGSRQEACELLDLVQQWKEKAGEEEYGSKEVEILFTAVFHTVNDLAERAYTAQGRCVKHFLIDMWVEMLTCSKKELDFWSKTSSVTLDDYLSASSATIGARICTLNSLLFIGVKLTQEMLSSQECLDLCLHISLVNRLLNDVQTFKKERLEMKLNSIDLQVVAHKITEEEAISKNKEMAEYHRRKTMQIVYKQGSVLPRECKDVFLSVCRMAYYLYSTGDEFTSPQQMMEDTKSLLYQPVKLPE